MIIRTSCLFGLATRNVVLVAGIFSVLMLTAGISSASRTSGADATGQRVEVTAKRFTFEPAEITVKKDQPVDLVLTSEDVAHGLRIRALGVEAKVAKGGTNEVHFTPSKTGTFVGQCSVFCGRGHGSMKLTLHVVD